MARVLILDDEPAVQHALALCVTTLGHQPEVCGDPAEALERLLAEPFDLLVTDQRMSGGTGLNVVLQLRRQRNRIPALLISASLHDIDPEEIRQAAVTAVLGKPFDFVQFRKVFESLVSDGGNRSTRNLPRVPSPVDPPGC
jgi:CheY-like chemotaxis protein